MVIKLGQIADPRNAFGAPAINTSEVAGLPQQNLDGVVVRTAG
jgi:hypothetical protein